MKYLRGRIVRKGTVSIDNLANFLFISPNQTKFYPLFARPQLDISAISDSVSAVSESYQLNYWKVANWT
jgi:hypothetical protein